MEEPVERKSGGAQVLVVEDDQDSADALANLLEFKGYHVAMAHDGRDALKYLSSHPPPALIILDLYMPRMNGWELLEELRGQDPPTRLPVVVVSAFSDIRGLDADAVLAKPIDVERLFAILEDLVQKDA